MKASKDSQKSLCCFGGESTVAWWLIAALKQAEKLGRAVQRIAMTIYVDQARVRRPSPEIQS